MMLIVLDVMKMVLLVGLEVFGGEMLFVDSFCCCDGLSIYIGVGEL